MQIRMFAPEERSKLTIVQMMTYNALQIVGIVVCLEFFTWAINNEYLKENFEYLTVYVAFTPVISLFVFGFLCVQIYYLIYWKIFKDQSKLIPSGQTV